MTLKHLIQNAIILALAACLTAPLAASAQSLPAPGQDDSGWRHSLSIYAFTPVSTTGTSTVNGQSVPIDLDLGDVLDLLDFAAAGRYEAWNGNLGLIIDANYVGIEAQGGLPIPPGSSFRVNQRQKWLALLAAYRVAHGTYGRNNQSFAIDVQGGLRYNSIKQEIRITTPGPITPGVIGGDESWVEPVIGARGMWRLNDRWTSIASIDLGGFGAGGNDLQVGANLGFDYQPWDNTALTFGYRYFSVDYATTLSGGAFAYDVTQHGPYLGVKFFF